MLPSEVETARRFISLLPYDAEVPVAFFFGAAYWNSLQRRDRNALGRDFVRKVASGELSGVAVIRSNGPNRWFRI